MSTLCIDFGGTEIKLGALDGPSVLAATALPNTGSAADLDAVRDAASALAIRCDAVTRALAA